jgi:uncharacterized membrane protein
MSGTFRHLEPHDHLQGAFGSDAFGRFAERVARFFGTPGYIVGQTIVVIVWIAYNGLVAAGALRFDPYPFILLNLAFSTQAAYAAPLILLASTRQAHRDKASEEAAATHREELAQFQKEQLEQNTEITKAVLVLSQEIDKLTREISARQSGPGQSSAS